MEDGRQNRRRFERIAIKAECKILALDGSTIEAASLNVSAAGIALHVPRFLQVGDECMLSIALPASSHPTRLNAWGKVIYCREDQGNFCVGLVFVDMDSCSSFHLRRLQRAGLPLSQTH